MILDSTLLFWLGMLLLRSSRSSWGWLPVFGAVPLGQESGLACTAGVLLRLILPAATLTLWSIGGIFLVAPYSMIGTMRQDFLLMAEAAGLSECRFRYGMRNSLLRVATVVILNVGFLIGGATVKGPEVD